MANTIDRLKDELKALIALGGDLQNSMGYRLDPKEFRKLATQNFGADKVDDYLATLPDFNTVYEGWYAEAIAVIRQLLPDRLNDFIGLYERSRNRKAITYSEYTVRDYIESLQRVDGSVTIAAGYPKFQQQVAILRACERRFESSLFEIRQLVQADLFDSEVDSGRELLRHGFGRAAGAVAGVVLEKHLRQVCDDHKISVTKKHPGISDLNELLKSNSVITIPQWRHITLLGDIRNLCDHSKAAEPTKDQITDLLDGTDKVLKTIS